MGAVADRCAQCDGVLVLTKRCDHVKCGGVLYLTTAGAVQHRVCSGCGADNTVREPAGARCVHDGPCAVMMPRLWPRSE